MIRVLQVVDGLGWGGTKEQTYLITRELSKYKDLEVHLAMAFEYKQMLERLQDYRVTFHFFENKKGLIGRAERFNPFNYLRLYRIIEQGLFDIVIANSSKILDYLRVIYPFLNTKPKLIAVRRTYRRSNFISVALKYSYPDIIVAISEEIKQLLIDEGIKPQKIVLIRSGVDLERFKPKNGEVRRKVRNNLGISMEEIVFTNVANWIPHQKGQHILLRAFKELDCKNCRLILVGAGTDTEGKKYALEHGLEERVLFLGFREDVEDLINASDFLVVSSFFEGMSNSLPQGMACGKVCIATDSGGIKEYLVDGYNGFLLRPGNIEDLRSKMELVLNLSSRELENISQNAIETAKTLSIQETARKYYELIKSLRNS